MSREPTYCAECDHVHPDTRKRLPTQWLCMRFPRVESGMGFVAPGQWVEMEPYNRCQNVNLGFCPLFQRRREGQLEMVK